MQLAVQTMTSFDESLALARWAEDAGLSCFAVADHYLSGPSDTFALDQVTLLAAIAALTDRIELATLVSPITFRHPAVLYKSAVTLDEVSRGRFSVGVGTGWMEEEHTRFGLDFPPLEERFRRLEEALAYITAARAGGAFAGSYYRLAEGAPLLPRDGNLRIVVGGGGAKRTPRLAGLYADEYNAFPAESPLRERVGAVRRHAAEAGRDPGSLLISIAFPLIVGEDRSEVEDRVREAAAERGVEPERVRRRWAELGIPLGTVDEYRSALHQLAADGVERVYFQVAFDSLAKIERSVGLLLD